MNDLPAKDDADLKIQAYYARVNILRHFLSPLSGQMFEAIVEAFASDPMRGMRLSAVVGELTADLVRVLGMEELAERVPAIGDWFVHSGVTTYRNHSGGWQLARIELPTGGGLEGAVRPDCRITGSAEVNMYGRDDVSFVVGRRTSAEKFDLVVAGYRDAYAALLAAGRTHRLDHGAWSGNAFDRPWRPSVLPGLLPPIRIEGVGDDEVLAYAVHDTVEKFTAEVETRSAWRLLYNGSEPAHEARHQTVFGVFAKLAFSALEIAVHPNADHGAGPTDLTLTLRRATHVVEFKKDTAPQKMLHGLHVQLPKYMDAAGAVHGTFIVMCHTRPPSEVMRLLGESECTRSVGYYAVDCRARPTASKA